MAKSANDWWAMMLNELATDGARDAEKGIYDPPHALCECCQDPQDEAENDAYRKGFFNRRLELGNKFRWR